MAFEVYFSISRTAVELITLTAIACATAYVVKDLMKEEDKESEASIF